MKDVPSFEILFSVIFTLQGKKHFCIPLGEDYLMCPALCAALHFFSK
jgi:hypothetical protein